MPEVARASLLLALVLAAGCRALFGIEEIPTEDGTETTCNAIGDVCRPSLDECDVEDTCGSASACPANVTADDGVACAVGSCVRGFCLPAGELIAYWNLDRSVGGVALEATGNAKPLRLSPSVTTTEGQLKGALALTGDSHATAEVSYTDAFTIVLWFRTAEGPPLAQLLAHGGNGPNSINAWISNGDLLQVRIVDADNKTSQLSVARAAADDKWHSLAISYRTGTGVKVYFDGGLRAFDTTAIGSLSPSGELVIGARDLAQPDPAFFVGAIDDVRIYSAPLTTGNVLDVYFQSGGPGPVIMNAIADAYVEAGTSSAMNFGTQTSLLTKLDVQPERTRDTLLRFDTSTLSPLARATFRIAVRNTGTVVIQNRLSTAAANYEWNETTVSYSTRPTMLTPITVFTVPTGGSFVEQEVTTAVMAAAAGQRDLTLHLAATQDLGAQGFVTYESRESAPAPHLVISAP